jgi:hypothetical protein
MRLIKLEDYTKEQLYSLIIDLVNGGAEFLGWSAKEFAENFGIDWSEDYNAEV